MRNLVFYRNITAFWNFGWIKAMDKGKQMESKVLSIRKTGGKEIGFSVLRGSDWAIYMSFTMGYTGANDPNSREQRWLQVRGKFFDLNARWLQSTS